MSMELNDIITLVKAGYTKDEIAQMAQPEHVQPDTKPDPVAAPEPVHEPEPEPVEKPVAVPEAPAQPAPVAVPDPAQPSMADIMQSIAKLTSAVQANAIANSVIPAGLQNPPSAEDMLAEIIRPTFKER